MGEPRSQCLFLRNVYGAYVHAVLLTSGVDPVMVAFRLLNYSKTDYCPSET